ncbi:MAG: Asp-tRNA(Asn)/Glu-tRNA(Gln) amidotransferase subunit GatC, partial [Lentisphaerota bacterium]
ARLHLTDEEITLFQGQLDQILSHVKDLSALDVEGVEPTAHARPVLNVFRKDEVRPSLDHDSVMKNAPASRHEQFVVPKIVE